MNIYIYIKLKLTASLPAMTTLVATVEDTRTPNYHHYNSTDYEKYTPQGYWQICESKACVEYANIAIQVYLQDSDIHPALYLAEMFH